MDIAKERSDVPPGGEPTNLSGYNRKLYVVIAITGGYLQNFEPIAPSINEIRLRLLGDEVQQGSLSSTVSTIVEGLTIERTQYELAPLHHDVLF